MKWYRDLHKLEHEISWDDIWKNARQPFRWSENKLTWFKIVNRLYYTPAQFYFKRGVINDSKCSKCGAMDGTLVYL